MTFLESETEIKSLFPQATLISFRYDKSISFTGKVEIRCGVIVIDKNGNHKPPNDAESFYSTTWSGVIKKIKIFLTPEETPVPEEGPPAETEERGAPCRS